MQQLPFLYVLKVNVEEGRQNLIFQRILDDPSNHAGVWGTHIDVDNPNPENVLIFVRGTVPRENIIDEINKVQTFFREQIEPK